MKLSTQDLITIKEALEELYTNGIDGIRNVDLDESDRLVGVFREGAKLYDFMLNPKGKTPREQISYKPKNPEVVNKKDSEIDWQWLVKNDAYTFFESHELKLDKKKNCVQQPCGNTCISMGKECNPDEPLSEKSRSGLMGLIDKIKSLFTGKKKEQAKTPVKPLELPKIEPKPQAAPVAAKPKVGNKNDHSILPSIENSFDDPDDEAVQVQSMMQIAGISEKQAKASRKAINGWTQEQYIDIRQYQRNGEEGFSPEKASEIKQKIDDIDAYARKAPAYEGSIYRGVSFRTPEERDAFLNGLGEGFELEAHSSYTSDPKIASSFASGDNDAEIGSKYGVVFEVKNRTGVSIRNLSDVDYEDEVLALKGARYRMRGKPKRQGSMFVVEMDEE